MPKINSPKIDPRKFQSLLEEKRSIAPLYTQEWNAADDRDTGVALLKIFTHMQEEIISRLNRVPDKNFTAFLEMIGLKLMPAQPAKVPVTFYFPESFSGGVFVPAGTTVLADETEKHKVLNFETTNGIFVTSATIEEIYWVDPGDDSVYRYTDNFLMRKEFSIFETAGNREELSMGSADSNPENKQEHILYLGHKEFFDLKNSAIIELHSEFKTGSVEYLKDFIWEYWEENDQLKKIKTDPNNSILTLPIETPISEKEINGVKTRWIRCRADKVTKSSKLPIINKVQIKLGSSNDQTIRPDIGFFNQVPLALNKAGNFYVFGKEPSLFNTFYIASREAFSKRDAVITITFIRKEETKMNPDSGSRTLSWEYWNGAIWSALSLLGDDLLQNFELNNVTNHHQEDYYGTIKFNIPPDVEEIEINGAKNYWIRVRLVEGNYGQNQYTHVEKTDKENEHWKIEPNFKPPTVNEINIIYSIDKEIYLQNCLSYNNLGYQDLTAESRGSAGFNLFTSLPEKYRTLYIGFKDTFKKGNISIFFSLKDMDYPLESRPKIRWTYWSKAPNLLANTIDTTIITLVSNTGISSDTELLFKEKIGSETKTETALVHSVNPDGTITLEDKLNNIYTQGACVYKTEWKDAPKLSAKTKDTTIIILVSSTGISSDTELLFKEKIGSKTTKETALVHSVNPDGTITLEDKLNNIYTQSACVYKRQKTEWKDAPKLSAKTKDTTIITLVSTTGISNGSELLFEENVGSEIITGMGIVDSSELNGIVTLSEKLNYKFTKSALVSKKSNLEVIDNTEHLTKTGTLEFISPPDQSKTHKFGTESYWLMGEFIKPGREQLIKGIYPNTVWAEQVETIKDETLGSGDGEKNRNYNFFRTPVISPEIWIRHEDIISDDEEDAPASEEIREIKDEAGITIETWVRWKTVEDFTDSGSRSRHCTIDNAMGTVQFGDGEHGMIPPIGQDNIKATYKTGGGILGNVAENEIKTLSSAIAGIDHITNHEPAEGGSDTELLREIFERGPHLLKHRDRAVTKEDFERLARAASSYIARTKCLTKDNKLTVIVIPKGEEDKPQPSRRLIEIVRKSLLERSLNMILEESLVVTGPSYVEIKVKVDVIPESIDQAIPLEKAILNRLKEYLHPLSGGNEGTGWEFGRVVHISDIYVLLERITGVDHVENLILSSAYDDDSIQKYGMMVCSGEHEITMKLGS